ncbi:jg12917 [Pararge aegeria aegeria]|uniref:Jg12917 protein n=1 Tax=Pararge aegeria aegeria TaxID=348720 RepID=A0A8S4SB56_9NEOP|nr:jg12917 [Pararge aegeria aegeria]
MNLWEKKISYPFPGEIIILGGAAVSAVGSSGFDSLQVKFGNLQILLWSILFNFVGKLLGPKGNSLKRLQEDTMCKMAVLGRGSMKDRQKEEELRLSGDPKFAHLSDELHVEISAFATPAEAHARIAYALAELRRFLVPDYNDDIRQEQMLEMQILSSQNEQRRLTPPDSSRSGSEETLPLRDNANKQRLPTTPLIHAQPTLPALPALAVNHTNAHEFSPPTPTPAPEHLTHHQLAPSHPAHGMLVSGGVMQQPPTHHLLAQNAILDTQHFFRL